MDVNYPFATTSAPADLGILGRPTTAALVGADRNISYDAANGFRAWAGMAWDESGTFGGEVSGFWLAKRTTSTQFPGNSAGLPVLAVPFFDVASGGAGELHRLVPRHQLGVDPGGHLDAGRQGRGGHGVQHVPGRRAAGRADLAGRRPVLPAQGELRRDHLVHDVRRPAGRGVARVRGTFFPGGGGAFAGTFFGPALAPYQVVTADYVQTRNDFFGGNVGFRGDIGYGNWFLNLTGKVAAGYMRQRVDLVGYSTLTASTGLVSTQPGGFFNIAQDLGRHHKDRFAVLPEGGVSVGYQVLLLAAGERRVHVPVDEHGHPADQLAHPVRQLEPGPGVAAVHRGGPEQLRPAERGQRVRLPPARLHRRGADLVLTPARPSEPVTGRPRGAGRCRFRIVSGAVPGTGSRGPPLAPGGAPGMTTFASKTAPPAVPHHQSFWLWVMCLTGVDYFSTLGYQPSIAFRNAGVLAPFATVVLVLVTLFGALPLYRYVAKRSFSGQASLGMLARCCRAGRGRSLVLVLLGFAATDFIITKTLSAADAAEHLIHNPFWPWHSENQAVEDRQRLVVTLGDARPARGDVPPRVQGGDRAGRGHRRHVPGPERRRGRVRDRVPGDPPGPADRLVRPGPGRGVVPGRRPAPRRAGSARSSCVSLLLFPKLALGPVRVRDRGGGHAAHPGQTDDDPKQPDRPDPQHRQAALHGRGRHVRVPARRRRWSSAP